MLEALTISIFYAKHQLLKNSKAFCLWYHDH